VTFRTLIGRIRNYFHPPRYLTEDDIRHLCLINPQFAHLMRDHHYDPSRHKVIFSCKPLSKEDFQALTRPRERNSRAGDIS
jgi:hypothetical protein